MMKDLAIIGIILGMFLTACFVIAMAVVNQCIARENDIDAQHDGNKVSLAGYVNKVMELVQVPKMAKDHILEVTTAAIQGRYGDKGAQAIFHAVREQNPRVDPGVYRTLMQAIEAGRNSFDADQKVLLDKCRAYKTYYEQYPNSAIVSFMGYPKLDKSKCIPVTTEQTEQDFKNKRTGPLQLQ